MRNKRKAHLTEYKAIIEEAIHRLPNGESRLSISGSPLNYACLKEFYAPDLSERLSSDHSMDSGNNEIENQYAEEVSAIEQLLIENDVQISLSGWQSRAKAAEKIFKGMNRKAYAIQMWEWYAIPWRFKGGKSTLYGHRMTLWELPSFTATQLMIF